MTSVTISGVHKLKVRDKEVLYSHDMDYGESL